MTTSEVQPFAPDAAEPLPIPSKWDIVPVHTSDRETFKSCRRRWGWSSPSRANLAPKTSVLGIVVPLWFGTGAHLCLQKYYSPLLREDPEVSFATWFNTEWNGGLIHESELDHYSDYKPVAGPSPGQYWIKGLNELLPDPDTEEFESYRDIGIGMMRFYKDYAAREDNFTVVKVEHLFSVPIFTPDGNPLYMPDTRTMPEEWEPDPAYVKPRQKDGHWIKQVHARGRLDMITQDNENGAYGIMDHKTVGRALDEDYFKHLDLDEQCTTYLYAGELEAQIYDLPYKQLDYITYQALRKSYPQPPTLLSSGKPSIDRQKETTTAQLFEKCIKDNGLQVVYDNDVKWQAYYTYLVEMGDKQFIWRENRRRNATQKQNCGRRMYWEATEMLSLPDEALYPNPTKNYTCLNCRFRAPCLSKEAGYDWEFMIESNYEANWDR